MDYKNKFIFIAGPCVIEDRKQTLDIAHYLKNLLSSYPVLFVFKASFDKANRTSISSFRGPGIKRGIKILEEVKNKFNIPILSDIHCQSQIKYVKDVLDIIQIPAFLCRQTDLILSAAKTNKIINIKKGQFLAPQDIGHIVNKINHTGNKKIWLTERGTCFGYNNLVVDFRSFLLMSKFGCPVIYDATHSLQKPSARGNISGGDRNLIYPLSLAATACGVQGIFMEVHPQPNRALSDKATSYPLNKIKDLVEKIIKIKEVITK